MLISTNQTNVFMLYKMDHTGVNVVMTKEKV